MGTIVCKRTGSSGKVEGYGVVIVGKDSIISVAALKKNIKAGWVYETKEGGEVYVEAGVLKTRRNNELLDNLSSLNECR